jgi:NADH-quinone oxidoreductase subunit J
MLLNAGVEERTDFSKLAKWVGPVLAFFMIVELGVWFSRSAIGRTVANGPDSGTAASTIDLSKMIFQQYLLPFEATSILILIAIIGALVLAKKGE